MACPFFMPMEKLEGTGWPHPARLPLGGGWSGRCTAPGHDSERLEASELQNCNLGYADSCRRIPHLREWDSVRFAVKRVRTDRAAIEVQYCCEREHRPAAAGVLEFDAVAQVWVRTHGDARVQKMAECFLESVREKWEVEESRRAREQG